MIQIAPTDKHGNLLADWKNGRCGEPFTWRPDELPIGGRAVQVAYRKERYKPFELVELYPDCLIFPGVTLNITVTEHK